MVVEHEQMIDRGKKNLLGVCVDAADYEAVAERVIAAAREQQPLTVSALAVHGVMTGVLDRIHRFRLDHLDLVLPDGQPVRWALNLLYRAGLPERVYGPLLMLRICEKAAEAGLPIYLYGSRASVLEKLQAALGQRYPGLRIAGATPSRFRRISQGEKRALVEEIRGSGARIVFVGLGCPIQEVWVYEHREFLPIPLLAVGAAFDFHAGTLPEAPAWMQRAGLGWLFRLAHEPRRLWRRYLPLNPLYLFLLFLQWTGLHEFSPAAAVPPRTEMRYG
jgi:exopolysaccharide biosynthesis WecB/TagA/CpsF family protein